MIIVRMNGGLGNQMFQYAFGKAYAKKLGSKLILDLSWYGRGDRKFLLDELKTSYDYKIWNRWIVKVFYLILRPTILKDEILKDTNYFNHTGHIVLDGWWESLQYFAPIEKQIREEFALKNPSKRFVEIANEVSHNSIAVHVRRGDYLIPHGKYLNGYEYYNRAVDTIIKKKGLLDPEIMIFSDDPEWCRKELKLLGEVQTKVFTEKMATDVEDLLVMSLYGHNVIASTFSWWSAFLNKNPDKLVTLPANMFTDPEVNKRYMARISHAGWIVIE